MASRAEEDVNSTAVGSRPQHSDSSATRPIAMQPDAPVVSLSPDKTFRTDAEGAEPVTTAIIVASRLPKLDGVLYHYYSKTLAAIVQSRLTHYESPLRVHMSGKSSEKQDAAANTNAPRRLNKWFDLDLTDYDLFREEIRLWRNISALVPAEFFEGPPNSTPSKELKYVPTMVVDVVLDATLLESREILTMDQSDVEGSKAKRRQRVHYRTASAPQSRRGSRSSLGKSIEDRRPIILETWKLELDVCNSMNPPDLPILYRQATANLKELLTIAKQLPAQSLYERVQKVKAQGEDEKLNIGIRLRIGEAEEESNKGDIIGLRETLIGSDTSTSEEENRPKMTEIFSFEPLSTALGVLSGSVEYRLDSDFFVEDVGEAHDDAKNVDLDEDFFRPGISQPTRIRPRNKIGTQSSPLSGSPSSIEAKRSPLSSGFERKQSNISTSQGVSSQSIAMPPNDASRAPTQPPTTSTSVFSTSAGSGKPVAGLANLRRSPSLTAHGSSPSTAMTGLAGASNTTPITTSALTSEAAFLTSSRRTSTGEKRVRSYHTLNGSGERDGPSAGSTGGPSGSPSQQTLNRPALARASVSANTSLRMGSYSPSSPSPLALQIFSNQQQQKLNLTQSRVSSSPSNRNSSLPLSTSPSLRSIFQSAQTSSQSQLSVSSLSRTPPRSLLEAGSSSTGLQGTATNPTAEDVPSQQGSTLAEGRHLPSVKPQMIKRYSSTFNYRQGRQYAGTSGRGQADTSLESELSTSAPYSKSWQARIEQRQQFAARSLGRGDGMASGSSGGGFLSSYSPQLQRRRSMGVSTSQEEDLDDFVRMIDLNKVADSEPIAANPSSDSGHQEANNASSSSLSAIRNTSCQRGAFGGNMSYSTVPSGVGFNRQYGWNRNQVDEMLNKMQASVRDFGTSSSTGKGSGTSGTSSSIGAGAGDSPSPGSQGGVGSGTAISGAAGFSPSFVRSPLSKVGFSAATPNTYASGHVPSRTSSTAAALSSPSPQSPSQQSSSRYQYDVSNRSQSFRGRSQPLSDTASHTKSTGMNIVNATAAREGAVVEGDETMERRQVDTHSYDRSRRSTSGGSIESLSHQPHSYDPLEDEAVGRLELVHDDIDTSGDQISSGANIDVGNRIQHHPRHHRHTDNYSEAARRRADLELARNFGQVVSSGSSRGGNARASQSPWRNRIHARSGNGHPSSPSLTSSPSGDPSSGSGNDTGNGNGL